MLKRNPQQLPGNWKDGFALEFHTTSSTPKKDEQGNIVGWDTIRPELAEELYRLKYWKEKIRVNSIAETATDFLNALVNTWSLNVIIPIPPSDLSREFQPVYEMALEIGKRLALPVDFSSLKKIKSTSELKSIDDPEIRENILKDAFDASPNILSGKTVLLFDDLFRSGETLKAATRILLDKGRASNVYVLTITKTRSKK